jgi:hypothetical protein
MKIDVVIIDFKSTSSLVLLRSEYSDLLNDSKRYGFDIKDIKRCRSERIDVKDFPKIEFNG